MLIADVGERFWITQHVWTWTAPLILVFFSSIIFAAALMNSNLEDVQMCVRARRTRALRTVGVLVIAATGVTAAVTAATSDQNGSVRDADVVRALRAHWGALVLDPAQLDFRDGRARATMQVGGRDRVCSVHLGPTRLNPETRVQRTGVSLTCGGVEPARTSASEPAGTASRAAWPSGHCHRAPADCSLTATSNQEGEAR